MYEKAESHCGEAESKKQKAIVADMMGLMTGSMQKAIIAENNGLTPCGKGFMLSAFSFPLFCTFALQDKKHYERRKIPQLYRTNC